MKYKYSLIVSQYYYSRHMFIVKIDENFIETARKFAVELMQYKRGDNFWTDKIYLGDLDPEYSSGELRYRYNINDAGDIYFINFNYANSCMHEAFEYNEASKRESAGYQKKQKVEDIAKHHDYRKVTEIVQKYFEIV